jgi:beta-mannanase
MTDKRLAYEETFMDQTYAIAWVGNRRRNLYAFAVSAWAKGRIPIITIEPFGSDPLNNVITGKSDRQLDIIASQLRHYRGPAIIRWGHECENSLYPWGAKAPARYVAAYRYVTGYLRSHNPQQRLLFLWSPIGNPRCAAYYPGSAYVDYVGCSVFDTHKRGFSKVFGPKYAILAHYGKPVIIAECGVRAEDNQAAWVAGLKASVKHFPLLKAIVYFNAKDSYAWVNGQKPDWRINPALWPPVLSIGEPESRNNQVRKVNVDAHP